MNFNYSKRAALIVLSIPALVWLGAAHAEMSFVSPAENASLSKSTVLTGSCTGHKDVVLNGPGIHKNKTISCQKGDKSSRFWSYALTNVYKDMPDGSILVTAAQAGHIAQRSFHKGSAAPTPGSSALAKCSLNGLSID